jgi:membrane protein DedA with SNARE-associated domain
VIARGVDRGLWLPVPRETVLILAAVYAGSGQLNIVLMALLASVALS